MTVVSMRELLEAGVHFGHQTRRWNPKMRRFIFTERGGIYIIDLQQTLALIEEAHAFARNIAERGGSVLFVGTKKQSQDSVAEEAARVGMPYVNHRWLGGLLTNWRTISERISRLHDLRRLRDDGQLELLPSKERISMMNELEKLEVNLGGVADMKSLPDAVFVVDLRKEQLAVREARRLNLPIIALVDTNCDPDDADFIIPGNDDAIRSCSLVVRTIASAIEAGKTKVTAEEMAAPVPAPEAPAAAEAAADEPAPAEAAEEPAPAEAAEEPPPRREPAARPRSRSPRRPRRPSRRPRAVRRPDGRADADPCDAGEGAARPHGRGDDGRQARARRDERRPRGRAPAPARARARLRRQACRARDVGGHRSLAGAGAARRHRRRRLRDRAGLRQRGVPRVRAAPPGPGRGPRARKPPIPSRRSGSSWSRSSERTSWSSVPSATRRRTTRS